jgi:glycosyltransferase involved in cell wall biosynthesis
MEDVRVSIFMLTYNQEEYIGQTIESVLSQNASFKYQLVIGEDCSTDNTRSICEKYANENKEKIKLLPSKENLGLINNFIRTFKECDGKYVAICDGDDYWIDPFKLQKQFDFLESNPDYSIVHTNLNFLYPNGKFHLKNTLGLKKERDFEDLVFENTIPSVTAFFRNKQHKEESPKWIAKFPYGDWPIYLWTIKDGSRIGFLEDVTAVYRKEIGVSEKLKKRPSDIAKVNLEIVSCIYEDVKFSNKKHIIKKSLEKHKSALLACYFREKKYLKSLRLAFKLAKDYPKKVVKLYAYLIKRKILNSKN